MSSRTAGWNRRDLAERRRERGAGRAAARLADLPVLQGASGHAAAVGLLHPHALLLHLTTRQGSSVRFAGRLLLVRGGGPRDLAGPQLHALRAPIAAAIGAVRRHPPQP